MIFSRPPFVRLRSSKKLVVLVVAVLVASLSMMPGGVAQAAPQPTNTASCQNPVRDYFGTGDPYAQTFTAQKSGKLTSAQVTAYKDGNYLLQIFGVDQNGTPSQVLASKTVPVSGANFFGNKQPKPAVAIYDPATAPTLEAGKQYAIGVANPNGGYGINEGQVSACSGQLYYSPKGDPQGPYTPVQDSGGFRSRFDFRVDVTPLTAPTPTPTPSPGGSGGGPKPTPAPGPTPKPAPQPAPAPGSPAPAPAPAPGPAPAPIVNTISQSQSASSGPVNQSASIPNNEGGGNDQASQQQLLQAANTANQQNEQAANQFANRNAASGPIAGNVSQANNVSQSNNQAVNVSPKGSQSAAQSLSTAAR